MNERKVQEACSRQDDGGDEKTLEKDGLLRRQQISHRHRQKEHSLLPHANPERTDPGFGGSRGEVGCKQEGLFRLCGLA